MRWMCVVTLIFLDSREPPFVSFGAIGRLAVWKLAAGEEP
jgi:hypothetical protein